ncbi:hypothetical protein Cgig2_024199 [Carnegiea gigantea]|uniref:MADS-box domain-containing protein n=1 Tax=Carnegiea gigantea TaxID=171969 RepID=A0A9Q1KHP1_9CARY|nr:hypothetical protein Cgig2_024199 [Carnegiea gigantea]
MGRRKLEMKTIANNSSRLVTFSKRRSGLFKKANEISTLCATEVAIVVFSPGGKPFSFGQPNVEKLVHLFQKKNRQHQHFDDFTLSTAKINRERINKLNQKVIDLEAKIEIENRRSKMLEEQQGKCKFEIKQLIEELDLDQLLKLQKKLQHLFEESTRRVKEHEASNSLLLLANASPSKFELSNG